MSCPGAGPNQPPEWIAYSAAVRRHFNRLKAEERGFKRAKDQAAPWWKRITG